MGSSIKCIWYEGGLGKKSTQVYRKDGSVKLKPYIIPNFQYSWKANEAFVFFCNNNDDILQTKS